MIVLLFEEGGYRDLFHFLPCQLPQNEFCLYRSYGRKGKSLEGLAPCGFPLAKADPATGEDLTVERMLCSSEEVSFVLQTDQSESLRAMRGGKILDKTKRTLWVHKRISLKSLGMTHLSVLSFVHIMYMQKCSKSQSGDGLAASCAFRCYVVWTEGLCVGIKQHSNGRYFAVFLCTLFQFLITFVVRKFLLQFGLNLHFYK